MTSNETKPDVSETEFASWGLDCRLDYLSEQVRLACEAVPSKFASVVRGGSRQELSNVQGGSMSDLTLEKIRACKDELGAAPSILRVCRDDCGVE